MRIRINLLALALIGISASLYAQRAAPPSPAAMLLRNRTELRLSNAQIKQLEALDQRYIREARPAEERLLQTRASERRLRAKEGELTPQESQQLSADRAAMRKEAEQLRTIRQANRDEAWKVLTPEQRTKAEQMMKERTKERRGTKKPGQKPAQPKNGSQFQLWFR